MSKFVNPKLIAGAAVGLAVAGGGAAVAATQFGSPKEETQAVVNDAASQLGVKPSALSAALKSALENRIDAAVAAGRLTKSEGDALKQRIESGDFPLFGDPGDFGFRLFQHGAVGGLDDAASYLGLTEAQLRTDLVSGKTLAAVAKSQKKSVDGLVTALVDAAKKRLDAAVAGGRLTQAQADSIAKDLKTHVTAFVNGTVPRFGFPHGLRHDFRDGPAGPVPGDAPSGPGFDGSGL